jgi:phage shock protein C
MVDMKAPLRRSRSNRMIAGVVAGLAQYFDIDVTLARVLYLLVTIFSAAFPGIIVYIILWIVIPYDDQEVSGRSNFV